MFNFFKKKERSTGVVVKSLLNYSDDRGNNKALKVISEAYLDNDNTDFQ